MSEKVHILAIGAHPDDIELGCGGTLIKEIEMGKKVGLLDLTQGELGTRGNKEIRKKEAELSKNEMGAVFRDNLFLDDCFFENNVKAIDGETTILAENLDLLATEDSATVYNNVFLTNDKGSLRADKVYYDFETKHYQVSMFSDNKVKIKLIK